MAKSAIPGTRSELEQSQQPLSTSWNESICDGLGSDCGASKDGDWLAPTFSIRSIDCFLSEQNLFVVADGLPERRSRLMD